MSSLPFVVAPKRETRLIEATINGETCSVKFPVYGSLLAGEEIAARDHEYQAAVYREASRLADALLTDNLTESDAQATAIRIISTRMGIPLPLTDREQRLMLRHSVLVAAIGSILAVEHQQQTLRSVTAVIRFRQPGCKDWTEADTEQQVPQLLQDAIAAFVNDERRGHQPQPSVEEQVEGMIDTLGKLAAGADLTVDVTPSTGAPPTGNADASGPTTLSSAASSSPISPSPTSGRRSRKANAG